MGKSHKSLSLFEFQQRFTSDNQCCGYLAAEKWKNGYVCSKCGHMHYCQGNTLNSRQCTRCKHTDFQTSGTLFHKVKFLLYRPLKSEFSNLIQLSSGEKGGNFPVIHRAIMLFKSWLRGIYHRITGLQAYIDEYTYRFNRHFTNASIFDNLILRMIKVKPYYLDD